MLTPRKTEILRLIVQDYIQTGVPVGSVQVVKRHGLPVSSATVRNEMSELEAEGYVSRPHSSAGAVPTDRGYRLYVQSLESEGDLELAQRVTIRHQLFQAQRATDEWLRLSAAVMAQLAQAMAMATAPRLPSRRLRHLDLVSVRETVALLILVLEEGPAEQLLSVGAPATQEDLQKAANRLNALYGGLAYDQIVQKGLPQAALERLVLESVLRIMEKAEDEMSAEFYVSGLSYMLHYPELSTGEQLRPLVEAVEGRQLLRLLLPPGMPVNGVQVTIGEENKDRSLWPFSVILAPYGSTGSFHGTLALIGPTRMEYTVAFPAIRFLSGLLNELAASFSPSG